MNNLKRASMSVAGVFGLIIALLAGAPSANAATPDVLSLWNSVDVSSVALTPQNESLGIAAFNTVSSASDQATALAGLSRLQLAALKAYVTPTSSVYVPLTSARQTTDVTSAVGPDAASTCYTRSGYFYEVDGFGAALWNFKTTGGWCSNGSKVTSSSYVGSYASVSFVGWFYKGLVGHSTGIVGGTGRTYSQGKFQFEVAGVVVQQVLPCNRVAGIANGTSTVDNTCGLSS